jgi:U4/U6 small nuclear ribonucleoprotein PRP31
VVGRELRDKIERQLEKLQEPAKRKEKKALPAPLETSRKKRGGRRHRKMKERFELTELSKQKNRMVYLSHSDIVAVHDHFMERRLAKPNRSTTVSNSV